MFATNFELDFVGMNINSNIVAIFRGVAERTVALTGVCLIYNSFHKKAYWKLAKFRWNGVLYFSVVHGGLRRWKYHSALWKERKE